jgi:hypothetical protein
MNKCTGVVCVAPSTCDPNTGQCTGTPPGPSDKCKGVVCVNTTCDPATGKCKDTPSSKAWIWILILLLVIGIGAYFFLRKK